MASNPSLPSDHGEEEGEEEHDEDEDDEDYVPGDETLNEPAAAGDSPEVEIIEIPANEGLDQDQGEEGEDEEEEEEEREESGELGKGKSDCESLLDQPATANCPICMEPWTSEGPHRVWYVWIGVSFL